jgi:tRNA (guanine37-N1)-methyltransferase
MTNDKGRMTMRIDILTLFPRMFEGVLGESILKIAQEKKILRVTVTNLRDFTSDRHKSVDDRPYGGGPGMVMKCEPVVQAVRAIRGPPLPPLSKGGKQLCSPPCQGGVGGVEEDNNPGRLLLMCPRGRKFDQACARELAGEKRLILLAGHYEGYDERIVEILEPDLVSIGDYVLTGGELPAMVVMDAVARLLPGVLGHEESVESESFAPGNAGLLEYPQYTRPAEFEGKSVPEILLSGDHAKIAAWRRDQAVLRTKMQRPDLLNSGF